ncbi:MAG: ATP-binding cassette domain-containing protein [Mycoplasmoidaceae bacterium]
MLKIINLNVLVNQMHILKNINFDVEDLDCIAILGENGNGKSSIFKAIMNHYLYNISGKILFKSVEINNMETYKISNLGIWYIPQISQEIEGLNLLDFLKAIYDNQRKKEKNFYSIIESSLKILKLDPSILDRDVNANFSGGEKKKIELLQLFLIKSELILLDEIDSGLDKASTEILIKLILDLKKQKKTIMIITHNYSLLEKIDVNKRIYIKKGEIEKIIS